MADTRGGGDAEPSGSSPSPPTIAEDLQRLSDRVTAQGQQLTDFIAMMTAHFAALTSTSTPTTITPTVQTLALPTAALAAPIAVTSPVVETVDAVPSPTPASSSTSVEAQLVKDFIRLKPAYFDGVRDFQKIEKWILSQEKLHRVLRIEDRLRAEISSYTLERDTDVWWRMTVATHEDFETWDAFKQKFYQQYFPPSVMKRLRREFMDWRQGPEETVMHYMDRYDYLC
ncbi:hypothetical protein Scep_027887 [Stephania cephalantha]|uniref:Retrotransposon gag domain-containing protein n=1 Tax=Stephania cephalantha TaxID=152367 RepID=A0AAP0EB37_9MAGN